jgi:hypothetical protein
MSLNTEFLCVEPGRVGNRGEGQEMVRGRVEAQVRRRRSTAQALIPGAKCRHVVAMCILPSSSSLKFSPVHCVLGRIHGDTSP